MSFRAIDGGMVSWLNQKIQLPALAPAHVALVVMQAAGEQAA